MKNCAVIVFCLCVFSFSFSQNEAAIWYFGQNAGLDFNSGVPVALTNGQLNTVEGCSAISDANGLLLFYTDGITVWNRIHDVMPNGTGLNGNQSSTQSAIIVPKPGDVNTYYIFTVDDEAGGNGLSYSEVDLTLDTGNGDITENKNIGIISPITEKISAIQHANGVDFWVITHAWQNADFLAYKITAAGIDTVPVISSVGSVHDGDIVGTIGYLKIAPNGEKLAIGKSSTGSFVEVFDFDNSTGIISNPQLINGLFYETSNDGVYGVEFSPNSELLYVSDVSFDSNINKVHQFDLTLPNVADIINSDEIIYAGNDIIGALQLAIDEKIYLANVGNTYIDVIENPNERGANANYVNQAISLDGRISALGLPPFIQSFFFLGIEVEGNCLGSSTEFLLESNDPIVSILWDFGDGNSSTDIQPSHVYSAAGTYTVTVTANTASDTKTLNTEVSIYDIPVPSNLNDYFLCDDDGDGFTTFDLSVKENEILGAESDARFNIAYYETATDAENQINQLPLQYNNTSQNQEIFVRIFDSAGNSCSSVSSFFLQVIESPELDMDENAYICINDTEIKLEATAGFDSYTWSTGEITRSIVVDEPGLYTVTVTADHHPTLSSVSCSNSFDITVSQSDIAIFENFEVLDWNSNGNSVSMFVDGIGDYEYSLDNITYQDSNVFQDLAPDEYTFYARDKNGCGIITEDIYVMSYPKFFTPNGDGYNDTWQIIFADREANLNIKIFDQYGKFLKEINPGKIGWDGTINGRKMPSTDYWFLVERPNYDKVYKGHFSLKR